MKLAHTALLRALVPEHGADGEEFADRLACGHAMFDVGTHDTCCGLGPQSHGPALGVGEGIHFLLHHVRFGADGAAEQIGVLHERSTQFAVSVAGKHGAGRGLHTLEQPTFRGEKIGETFDGLNLCHKRTPEKNTELKKIELL